MEVPLIIVSDSPFTSILSSLKEFDLHYLVDCNLNGFYELYCDGEKSVKVSINVDYQMTSEAKNVPPYPPTPILF